MSLDLPEWARRALRCPATGAPLESAEGWHGQELVARTQAAPRLAYPVRDGVPVLLVSEAREIRE